MFVSRYCRFISVLGMICVGTLCSSCRTPRPSSLSRWKACLLERAELKTFPHYKEKKWTTLRAVRSKEGHVLALYAKWGQSLFVSEYQTHSLFLSLPKVLEVGKSYSIDHSMKAMARSAGMMVGFESYSLRGNVVVVKVEDSFVELEVSLYAEKPIIDIHKKKRWSFQGRVRAWRTHSLACK